MDVRKQKRQERKPVTEVEPDGLARPVRRDNEPEPLDEASLDHVMRECPL